MSFPQDLLEQARHLATREPRRPKQASLRRSISTAYYALFHMLIEEAVKNWRQEADRPRLARLFEHGLMKHACVKEQQSLRVTIRRAASGSPERIAAEHLDFVAQTFADMQQARHTADYDSETVWTRTDVNTRIESVQQAFDRWNIIRNGADAQAFLLSLLMRERRS